MNRGAVHQDDHFNVCMNGPGGQRDTPYLAAMASPAFKQSFARFPGVPVKQALEKTVVRST